MRKRAITLLLVYTTLFGIFGAAAESGHLAIKAFPDFIRPGKSELYQFTSAHAGQGAMALYDREGQKLFDIFTQLNIVEGLNSVLWNGNNAETRPISAGDYTLEIMAGEDIVRSPLSIGQPSPRINQLKLQDATLTPGEDWSLSVDVNMKGVLAVVFHVADKNHEIFHAGVEPGTTSITWDGMLEQQAPPAGRHTLSVMFLDETGFAANQQHITLEVKEPAPEPTPGPDGQATPSQQPASGQPADSSPNPSTTGGIDRSAYHYRVPTAQEVPREEYGKDFWRLPVGDYNEEAIWKVMMQPITVLWGKDQRDTYKLRASKDDSAKRENILGEVGYESQGVHVIEQTDDGWSLVEVYNSSYGPNNRSRRGYGDTDALLRGYIRTAELKVITPRDDYGILIDKLKQRMYIFKEGKIFTELLISTGNPTKKQPWNESPSGEFLMVSRTGDFNAGNLVCRMAMRINGGVLIHEVPYILNESTGYWDYSSQEAQLGKKASHGCIRVQRLNNNEGINMTWLWKNIKNNTKVLVWDDDNRFYDYPEESLALFFNPNGGKYYHLDQNCKSIKDRYLPLEGSLYYHNLDDSQFTKLTPCPYCNPPIRASEIDSINKANGF